jgi:galactonate dehydratase
VPNYAWLEDRAAEFTFGSDLFPVQHRLSGVSYPLPTGPGLGVEFNEDMAGKPFEFWEAPRLHRRDGSYTNW